MTDITNQKHRLLTRGSPHDRHDACDMLDALAKERDELRAEVERLRVRVTELERFIPHQVVECRGDKCREPWCASCYGWEDAEAYIAALQRKEGNE